MYDDTKIVRERQCAIRRRIDERGILVKTIAADGGWDSPSTVQSYFPADEGAVPAIMSVAALHRLIRTKALPLDLLSDLLPAGFAIIQAPEEIDHDEIAAAFGDYLTHKHKFHHPDSENGPAIGPGEDAALRMKLAAVPGKAVANG